MHKKELWLNIANYHFDHLAPVHLWDIIVSKFGGQNPFTKAFADKLTRKMNWNRDFALKAIWEYKKFVYLGVISDFSITPSKVIDQVWHEHILFSAGYRKFCEDIIQFDFSHNPELIPVIKQTDIFQIQYFNTIELYEKEFGAKPPADIWDTTKFAEVKKKHSTSDTVFVVGENDGSLISLFPSADSSAFEFGGGEFGGGGADGGWDDGSDAVSDGDGSGGDSAGDGGSSCSSSCGSSCGGD